MALRAAFSWMLAVFAGLAFLLAIGGAYGVATYLVTQRTREIGIRVALGARTADIFRSVVASGIGVVVAGVALGLVAAVIVAGQLGTALFGVSTRDAGVLSLVTVVLVGTALSPMDCPPAAPRESTRCDRCGRTARRARHWQRQLNAMLMLLPSGTSKVERNTMSSPAEIASLETPEVHVVPPGGTVQATAVSPIAETRLRAAVPSSRHQRAPEYPTPRAVQTRGKCPLDAAVPSGVDVSGPNGLSGVVWPETVW